MTRALAPPAIINVSADVLKLLGLSRVEARSIAPETDIYQMLIELQNGPAIHPWKNLSLGSPVDLFKKLLNFENHKRPTDIFFYYAVSKTGEQELIGCGAVAHRIKNEFPHDGYPVVTRCYIKEKFKKFRLYFPTLMHRFDYCQKLYGNRLRAVYYNSPNPVIYNVVKRDIFGIHVLYVGDEEQVQSKTESAHIKNYLWMTPALRHELMSVEKTMTSNKAFRKLVYLIKKFIANEFTEGDFGALKNHLRQVETELGWSPKTISGFREFVESAEAVGILNKDKAQKEDLPPVKRRFKKAA